MRVEIESFAWLAAWVCMAGAFGVLFLHRCLGAEGARPARMIATWYGEGYRGKRMANGEPFDPDGMTCASFAYPLGSLLRVACPNSGAAVVVEVTDRGPAAWTGAKLDLSARAFRRIAAPAVGRVPVVVTVLRPGPEQTEGTR